jgi:tetratricopeptide (TPR) repeat protein
VWQKKFQPQIDAGKLTVVGIVQEQHPNRTKLYKQWKQYKFPILVDALNQLDFKSIPIKMMVKKPAKAKKPGIKTLERKKAWRDLGDHYFVYGANKKLNEAVASYEKAVAKNNQDARAHFRLGVALRRRYESKDKQKGDDQAAVNAWMKALALDPNQYIWRRRLQQYGPRLNKPYNFYSWVKEARKDIKARGEKPIELAVEPRGTEIAGKSRRKKDEKTQTMPDPDPEGKINRDKDNLISVDVMVTPQPVRPGGSFRLRLSISPDKNKVKWNNEAGATELHLDLPKGFTLVEGQFSVIDAKQASSSEKRVMEVEVSVDKNVKAGQRNFSAYLCFHACTSDGVCFYLRRDIKIKLKIDKKAASIK